MTIYVFSILILFILSCLEVGVALSPSAKKALAIFVYIFLVLQVGLRWETGTDWNNYFFHFTSISSFASASPSIENPEYGYNLAIWLIKIISPSYSLFLLVHAAVYYYLIFNSVKRYTGLLFLPLMIFYCSLMGVTGSNRELIALAIGLYALRYIIEGKRLYFVLFVALACMFHYSAVILFLFLLCDVKIRPSIVMLILACSIAIGFSQLPSLMFAKIAGVLGAGEAWRAALYLSSSKSSLLDSGLSVVGLVKRVFFLALFVYNRPALSKKMPYYNVMLNAYIAGVVVYCLFANSLLILVSRGDMYFNILEPLLLASQVHLLARPSNRIAIASVLCAMSFVLFFQSISPYPDLFVPYKGLFMNSGYWRMMY